MTITFKNDNDDAAFKNDYGASKNDNDDDYGAFKN